MAKVGYIRVSSADQNTGRQLSEIELDRIYTDKCSGSSYDRPQLEQLRNYVREGDHLFVHSIDRLARNLKDLKELVYEFKTKGVSVTFVKNNLNFTSDTNNPMNNLLLDLLGAVAEFERELIRERQREGIAKAKKEGKFTGRRATIDKVHFAKLVDEGYAPTRIRELMGISKTSYYRLKAELSSE